MGSVRVAIDTGGTFTDLLATSADGAEYVVKVPSTPSQPWLAVFDALERLQADHGVQPSEIEVILHGTTVGINALLQGRCPPAGLITTKGFRNVLEIGRQTIRGERGSVYTWVKPERLVPLPRIREVEGRLDSKGVELRPLDEAGLLAAAGELYALGVRNFAVCFINSYANPVHERRAKALLTASFPDCSVVTSTETLPEFREYERTVATVINTLLRPIVGDYIEAIRRGLAERSLPAPLFVMRSDGGVMTARRAAGDPVQSALSGPAGAAIGLAAVARACGRENVITFDMGGTSTDVSLVEGGQPAIVHEAWIGEFPLRLPSIDVVSVGAGGGSIAWIAPGNFARVGPQSAGSTPGPACYARGGDVATISDANLYLGRLSQRLAGGSMVLQPDLAKGVIERYAEQLGVDPVRAAHGILELANFSMADAIRQVSVAKGRDVRRFSLVAAGGAGPLHAGRLAQILKMEEIIIPLTPGVGCAVGLLASDVFEDAVVTLVRAENALDVAELEQHYQELERQVVKRLESEGFAADTIVLTRAADLRYKGQRTELTVDVPAGPLERVDDIVRAFHRSYRAHFDYDYENEQPTELVNLRVRGVVPLARSVAPNRREQSAAEPEIRDCRPVYFDGLGWTETPVYQRPKLAPGQRIPGPAVIEQYDTTTLVLPGQNVYVDATGVLIIRASEEPSR